MRKPPNKRKDRQTHGRTPADRPRPAYYADSVSNNESLFKSYMACCCSASGSESQPDVRHCSQPDIWRTSEFTRTCSAYSLTVFATELYQEKYILAQSSGMQLRCVDCIQLNCRREKTGVSLGKVQEGSVVNEIRDAILTCARKPT